MTSAQVEIVFFGRPEGLEVSSSKLLQGLDDSLYPSPGVLNSSDGIIWRLQFLSQKGQVLQILSCFRSMGSPTRGAGGFIGVAGVMAGQYEISASLTSHLLGELDRFSSITTNGVQFVSAHMDDWPIPLEYSIPIQLRSTLYSPIGGKGSFVGSNVEPSSPAEQIERSIRTNRLNGSTEAVFVSVYTGDRHDVADLNQVPDELSNFSAPQISSSGALELEVEITNLKEKIRNTESELVQLRERHSLELENQDRLKAEIDSLRKQLRQERSKQSDANKSKSPGVGIWVGIGVVVGVVLGFGGMWLSSAIDFDASTFERNTDLKDAVELADVVESAPKQIDAFDVVDILKKQPLSLNQMSKPEVQGFLFNMTYPEITGTMIANRFESIKTLFEFADKEFKESNYCSLCVKYAIPEIKNGTSWHRSVMAEFNSKNPKVEELMKKLIEHANSNPLFQQGREWKLIESKTKKFDAKRFEESKVSKECSNATLPGLGIDEETLTALCWNINKYSFDAAKNGKKDNFNFMTWKLPKRD
jgi:hypothetical protein